MEYELIPFSKPKTPNLDSDRYELVPFGVEPGLDIVEDRESPGFIGSIKGGIKKMHGLGYGAAALAPDLMTKYPVSPLAGAVKWLLPEEEKDAIGNIGVEGYKRKMKEAEEFAPTVRMRDLKEHPEKIGTWAIETAGDLIPSMAEAAVGAVIGSMIMPGPGTAVGAFATRTILKKGIEKAVAKGIKNRIRDKAGRVLAEKELRKLVTKEAVKKLGASAGMFGTVAQMEAGGNYAELLTEHGVKAPMTSLMTGTVAASLEFLGGNSRILRKMFGGKTQRAISTAIRKKQGGYLKRLAGEILKNPPMEALQEGGQEALSVLNIVANTDEKFFTGENLWQIAESMGAGALGGGMGVPVQAMGAQAEHYTIETPSPEQERLNLFANMLNQGMPVEELRGHATPQEIENLKALFPEKAPDFDALIQGVETPTEVVKTIHEGVIAGPGEARKQIVARVIDGIKQLTIQKRAENEQDYWDQETRAILTQREKRKDLAERKLQPGERPGRFVEEGISQRIREEEEATELARRPTPEIVQPEAKGKEGLIKHFDDVKDYIDNKELLDKRILHDGTELRIGDELDRIVDGQKVDVAIIEKFEGDKVSVRGIDKKTGQLFARIPLLPLSTFGLKGKEIVTKGGQQQVGEFTTGRYEPTNRSWAYKKSANPPAAPEAVAKEPWEMGKEEFADQKGVLHHGTPFEFDEFDLGKMRGGLNAWSGEGINFTSDKISALAWGESRMEAEDFDIDAHPNAKPKVISVQPDFKNTLDPFNKGAHHQLYYSKNGVELRKMGFDSIKVDDTIVALDTSKIKTHKAIVQQALKEGKPVPKEVLAEYPDLEKAGEGEKKAKPTKQAKRYDRVFKKLKEGKYKGKIQGADYANIGLQRFLAEKMASDMDISVEALSKLIPIKITEQAGWKLPTEPTVEEVQKAIPKIEKYNDISERMMQARNKGDFDKLKGFEKERNLLLDEPTPAKPKKPEPRKAEGKALEPEPKLTEKEREKAFKERDKAKGALDRQIAKADKAKTIRQWIAWHPRLGVNPKDKTFRGELEGIRFKFKTMTSKTGKVYEKKVPAGGFTPGFWKKNAPGLDEMVATAISEGWLQEGASDTDLMQAITDNTGKLMTDESVDEWIDKTIQEEYDRHEQEKEDLKDDGETEEHIRQAEADLKESLKSEVTEEIADEIKSDKRFSEVVEVGLPQSTFDEEFHQITLDQAEEPFELTGEEGTPWEKGEVKSPEKSPEKPKARFPSDKAIPTGLGKKDQAEMFPGEKKGQDTLFSAPEHGYAFIEKINQVKGFTSYTDIKRGKNAGKVRVVAINGRKYIVPRSAIRSFPKGAQLTMFSAKALQNAATKHNLIYDGQWDEFPGKPYQFTDKVTKSSILVRSLDELPGRIKQLRKSFDKEAESKYNTQKRRRKRHALRRAKGRHDVSSVTGSLARRDLRESFNKHGFNRTDTVTLLSGQTGPEYQAIRKILEPLRIKPWFFSSNSRGINSIGGVTIPGHPTEVFVNVASRDSLLFTAGHESLHSIQRTDPDLYAFIDNALRDNIVDFQGYLKRIRINRSTIANIPGLKEGEVKKGKRQLREEEVYPELYADFLGEQFGNMEFWRKLHNYNPTFTERLIDVVKRVLDRIQKAIGLLPDYRGVSETYFRDIGKAQDVLAQVLGQVAERRKAADPHGIYEFAQPAFQTMAWHGQTKAGKPITHFDPEMIGTGAGLALGWGVYISEQEGVGRYYAELGGKGDYSPFRYDTLKELSSDYEGFVFSSESKADDATGIPFDKIKSDIDINNTEIKEVWVWDDNGEPMQFVKERGEWKTRKTERNLYEVSLGKDLDDMVWLQHDVSLKNQSKNVKDSLSKPPGPESRPNRILRAIEFIGDTLKGKAFVSKGYGGLDVPTQSAVNKQMFTAAQDPQILKSIVKAIPVDVMNILKREKLTPEMLFHKESMLRDWLASHLDSPVSTSSDTASTIAFLIYNKALAATKDIVESQVNLSSGESFTTVGASERVHKIPSDLEISQYIAQIYKKSQDIKGGELYQKLSKKLGSDRKVSEFLARAGIDGVKAPVGYFGGGGKGQTEGKFNYVIFDPSKVKIEKHEQFSYAGQRATAADKSAFAKAVEMEQAGKDNEAIRKETGWFLGMDDMWRFEIDDSKAELNNKAYADAIKPIFNEGMTFGVIRLGNLLTHSDLFKAYPELKKTQIIFLKGGKQGNADYQADGSIRLYGATGLDSINQAKEILLHEIQHAIQEIEGFAKGGSTNAVFLEAHFQEEILLAKENPRFALLLDLSESLMAEGQSRISPEVKEVENEKASIYEMHLKEKYGKKTPEYEYYRKLAGEIESRDVSERMDLSPGERAINFKKAQRLWKRSQKIEETTEYKKEEAEWNKSDFSEKALQKRNNSPAHKKFYGLWDEVESLGYDINQRMVTKALEGDEVSQRLMMTEPYVSQGIPKEEAIVRFGGGGAQMSVDTATSKIKNLPAFKKWFGDAVATETEKAGGEPRVFYHGTANIFEVFRHGKHDIGIHLGTAEQASDRLEFVAGKEKVSEKQSIMPVYSNFKNPLILKNDPGLFNIENFPSALEGTGEFSKQEIEAFKQFEYDLWDVEAQYREAEDEEGFADSYELQEVVDSFRDAVHELLANHGFDSIKYWNTGEIKGMAAIMRKLHDAKTDEEKSKIYKEKKSLEKTGGDWSYVVFDPKNIKSIFNEIWNPEDPRISYSLLRKERQDVSKEAGPEWKKFCDKNKRNWQASLNRYRKSISSGIGPGLGRPQKEAWRAIKVDAEKAKSSSFEIAYGEFKERGIELIPVKNTHIGAMVDPDAKVAMISFDEKWGSTAEQALHELFHDDIANERQEAVDLLDSVEIGSPEFKKYYNRFETEAPQTLREYIENIESYLGYNKPLTKEQSDEVFQYLNRIIAEEMAADYVAGRLPDTIFSDTGIARKQVAQWESSRRRYSGLTPEEGLDAWAARMAKEYIKVDKIPALKSALDKMGVKRKPIRARIDEMMDGMWSKINEGMADRFGRLKEIDKAANEGKDPDIQERSYVAARMTTSHADTMGSLMLHGVPVWEQGAVSTPTVDEGFAQIFAPVADKLDLFFGWLVGERAGRLKMEGRENLFNEEEIEALQGIFKDLNPEEKKSWRDVRRKYVSFKKKVLDFAEESGVIDPDARKVWDKADYVPFYRLIEEVTKGPGNKKAIASQWSGIRKLKGGESPLGDIFGNMMMNFSHLVDASVKNHATGLAVKNALKIGAVTDATSDFQKAIVSNSAMAAALRKAGVEVEKMDKNQREIFQAVWQIVAPTEKDVVHVLKDGKPKYYHVHDGQLLAALTAINEKAWTGFGIGAMRKMKRMLTIGVTASPEFMVRNILRDTLHAWVVSKATFKPGLDSAKGMVKAWQQNENYVKMMAAGALFHGGYTYGHDPEAAKILIKKLIKDNKIRPDTILDTPKRIWNFWQKFGNSFENATRIQIYDNIKAKGGTHLEAAFAAKDIMDYSLRGNWNTVRFLVETVPFLGARLQGLYRFGRGAKEHPVGFALKGTTLMLASLALLMMNWDDDRYKELEEWDKDFYYHFWIGDNHFRLPKPFEAGALFSTVPERMTEYFLDSIKGEGDAALLADRLRFTLTETFAVGVPQMFGPAIEQFANKSFFTKRPIISQGLEGKLPVAQHDPWTSESLRKVAETLPGTAPDFLKSPKRLQHLIRGYFGTMGMYALMAADVGVRNLWDFPETPTSRIEDYPVVRSFYQNPDPRHTKYVSGVYDLMREVDAIHQTVNHYRKTGNIEKASDLIKKETGKLKHRRHLNKVRLFLRKTNKGIKAIHLSKTLSGDVKRSRIDSLIKQKNKIVKQAYETVKGDF